MIRRHLVTNWCFDCPAMHECFIQTLLQGQRQLLFVWMDIEDTELFGGVETRGVKCLGGKQHAEYEHMRANHQGWVKEDLGQGEYVATRL